MNPFPPRTSPRAHRLPLSTSTVSGRAPRRRGWAVAAPLATLAVLAAACVPSSEPGAAPEPAPVVRDPGLVQAPPVQDTPATPPPAGSFIATNERLGVGGCRLFPTNNVFHADISSLPASPSSAATIAAAGADLPLRTSFRNSIWQGSRGGIPVNIVDSGTTRMQDVNLGTYHYMSDGRNHPIPSSPKVEGYPGMAWDRHMLIVDSATCTSHEFFYVTPPVPPITTRWTAETAVKFRLSSNAARSNGSALASGFSMLSRMIRYDEIAAGQLNHVLGMSLPTISNQDEIWPASQSDGRSSDPNAPRMGTWFRLRADADLSGLGPQALLIARALQRHGAILGDTGPPNKMTIVGENSDQWDNDDIDELMRFTLRDFEVVDPTPMKVSDTSHEIR